MFTEFAAPITNADRSSYIIRRPILVERVSMINIAHRLTSEQLYIALIIEGLEEREREKGNAQRDGYRDEDER